MEDELITFETAKLAKDKGFEVSVLSIFNYFTSTGGRLYNVKFPDKTYFVRPTQSLLQKWLREVHKVDFTLYLDNGGYTVEWSFLGKNNKWDPKKQGAKEDFKTYEEALEAGLQEALKLIKV